MLEVKIFCQVIYTESQFELFGVEDYENLLKFWQTFSGPNNMKP